MTADPRDRRKGPSWALASMLLIATIVVVGLGLWRMLGGALDTPPTPPVPPPVADDASARQEAIDAASAGSVRLLSYTPETMRDDFAAAKKLLTGDFLAYYQQFTDEIVLPAAEQKNVKTSATIVRAGVIELQTDTAKVLLFINQNTTSTDNPDGSFTASSVAVTMERIDGAWLISAFDPV